MGLASTRVSMMYFSQRDINAAATKARSRVSHSIYYGLTFFPGTHASSLNTAAAYFMATWK
jgi:hypothetical protein